MPYPPNSYPSSSPYYYGGGHGGLDWGNNSLVYGYGYPPYNTYSTAGNGGQLYDQHYQYPPYFKQMNPKTSSPYVPNSAAAAPKDTDLKSSPADVGLKENNLSDFSKSLNAFDGSVSPTPWKEGSTFSNGHSKGTGDTADRTLSSKNQYSRPSSPYMGMLPRLGYGLDAARGLNGMYGSNLYGHNWNTYGLGMGYGSNTFGMARNGYGWTSIQNKYNKPVLGVCFNIDTRRSAWFIGKWEVNRHPRP